MYNTKFVCTYNHCKESYFRDELYQKDLMYAFNIEDLNFEKHEKEINDEMLAIFDKITKYAPFLECIKKSCALFSSDDEFIGFAVLMSYDFLYLTHPCICEFLENNLISNEKIKDLLTKLNSFQSS